MELKDTVKKMSSDDYKERFEAEYIQTKIRYEKLRDFNNKLTAAEISEAVEEPKHDCPLALLKEQQVAMGKYLQCLEIRAKIEKIELPKVVLE